MKIVQVVPRLESGGVERGSIEVATALVASGHEAVLISQGGRLVDEVERVGARHVVMSVADKSIKTLGSLATLKRWLEIERPDVIHPRSRIPAWLCWHIWKKMPVGSRPRLVTSVHGLHSVNRYSAVVSRGERVEVVSRTARQYLEDHYVVDPPDKVRVIQRGIDPNVYFPGYQPRQAWLDTWNRAWGSTPRAPTLVLPGRLTRLKGHEALFPLVRSLVSNGRDVRVAVVGGADPKRRRYARGIQSTVRNDPVLSKHIVFLGHRSDLREIMSVADIVLSLSTRPESFGRTVLEALSLGTPVVGYRHGGVGEILNEVCPDGAVDPDKPEDVVARIESFLESPPLIANHEFTLQNMCRQTIAMYQELSS